MSGTTATGSTATATSDSETRRGTDWGWLGLIGLLGLLGLRRRATVVDVERTRGATVTRP
jgi:MYXO-CTERM domain-containing protein